MSEIMDRIRKKMNADVVIPLPATGGGAFGAARLAGIIASLQSRLVPSQGLRPGRPTDSTWTDSPKVPMSEATVEKLTALAEQASLQGRKISPMQLAAQLLEESLANISAEAA